MTDPLAPLDTLIGYVNTLLDCPNPETSTVPIVVAARERQAALRAWEASRLPAEHAPRDTSAAQEPRAA